MRVQQALQKMLERDFEGAPAYREQLEVAQLRRHATGCGIEIDRSRAAPAPFDPAFPADCLPVEASGHGKLWILLHVFEGYLDDLELLDAAQFPDPATLRIR